MPLGSSGQTTVFDDRNQSEVIGNEIVNGGEDELFRQRCHHIIHVKENQKNNTEKDQSFSKALNMIAALLAHPDVLFSEAVFDNQVEADKAKIEFDSIFEQEGLEDISYLHQAYNWVLKQNDQLKKYYDKNISHLKENINEEGRSLALKIFINVFLSEISDLGLVSRMFSDSLISLNTMLVPKALRDYVKKIPGLFENPQNLEETFFSIIEEISKLVFEDFKKLFPESRVFEKFVKKFSSNFNENIEEIKKEEKEKINKIVSSLISLPLFILFEETRLYENEFHQKIFEKIFDKIKTYFFKAPFYEKYNQDNCYEKDNQDNCYEKDNQDNCYYKIKQFIKSISLIVEKKPSFYYCSELFKYFEFEGLVANIFENIEQASFNNIELVIEEIFKFKSKIDDDLFQNCLIQIYLNARAFEVDNQNKGFLFSEKCITKILTLEEDELKKFLIGLVDKTDSLLDQRYNLNNFLLSLFNEKNKKNEAGFFENKLILILRENPNLLLKLENLFDTSYQESLYQIYLILLQYFSSSKGIDAKEKLLVLAKKLPTKNKKNSKIISINDYKGKLLESIKNNSIYPIFFDEKRTQNYLIEELNKIGNFRAKEAIIFIFDSELDFYKKIQLIAAIAKGKCDREHLFRQTAARRFYKELSHLYGVNPETHSKKITEFLKARYPKLFEYLKIDIEAYIQECISLRDMLRYIPLTYFPPSNAVHFRATLLSYARPLEDINQPLSFKDLFSILYGTEVFFLKEQKILQAAASQYLKDQNKKIDQKNVDIEQHDFWDKFYRFVLDKFNPRQVNINEIGFFSNLNNNSLNSSTSTKLLSNPSPGF